MTADLTTTTPTPIPPVLTGGLQSRLFKALVHVGLLTDIDEPLYLEAVTLAYPES